MRIHRHTLRLQAATLLSIAFIAMLPACTPAIRTPGPVPVVEDQAAQDYFPKSSETFYFNLLAAQLSINNGDWIRARDFYLDALKQTPDSPYILLQLSHLAIILGEPHKAEEYCRLALEHDPHFFEARQFMARLLGSRDQTEDAIAQYLLLLNERPGDEETLLALAKLYAAQKQPEKALDAIDDLLAAHPNSAVAFLHKGRIYAEQGDTAKAEAAFRKAIELNPEFLPPRINLAGMYETNDDLDIAIQTYQEIADLVPDNQLVHSKLAYLYIKTGNIDAALSQYQFLLDSSAQFNEEIALKIALLYFEQGNFADAELLFRRITAENPENQHAHYYLGHALVKTLKPEEAAQSFQAITPDSDLFAQARIQLAFIHSQAGDTSGAQNILQEAIALLPDDVSLYHALAIVHAEGKDYQSAVAALQKAIEHDKTSENLLLYLGHLYEKAGMFDESIATMREVLEINSRNADALNFIGYLYADRGIRLREARTLIKKALSVKPDDGYILDSLGWVYYKMEKYKKALKYLEQAHQLVPDDPTIAEHLGDAYNQLNKTGKARELYRRALELAPDKQAVQQKINKLEGL